jgi:hypothetical protein
MLGVGIQFYYLKIIECKSLPTELVEVELIVLETYIRSCKAKKKRIRRRLIKRCFAEEPFLYLACHSVLRIRSEVL